MNTSKGHKTPLRQRSMRVRLLHPRVIAALAALGLAIPIVALAGPIDIPHQFSAGDVISAAEFNDNFDAISEAINDNDARLSEVEVAVEGLGVPVGTIAFFAIASCPTGWAEHADLRGRVPLGLPASGTVSYGGGTALDNEDTRTISQVPLHNHGGGSLSGSTNSVPAHSHSVTNGGHNHPISGSGTHSHTIDLGEGGGFSWRPHWSGATQPAAGDYEATGGAHTHTIAAGTGTHSHTVSSEGGHSHTVSISGSTANNTGGVASVDVTMPYLQLLACEKT